MSQKFAVFDIDGTVIRWQLYHAIVDELIRLGALKPEAGEAIQAARMSWKQRTHEDSFRTYEKVLVETYHQGITHLRTEVFETAIQHVFDEYKNQVYRFSRELIRSLKQQGYFLLAISGSHQEIISKLADYYGFDVAVGQLYERRGDSFSGAHTSPMHHKDVVLRELIATHGLSTTDSIAVGDSEGDIPMLNIVERPIAFNPSRGLFVEAHQQGWKIVVERKNMIYELESQHGHYTLND